MAELAKILTEQVFKEHFFTELLVLTQDPVSEVRISACRSLAQVVVISDSFIQSDAPDSHS